MVFPVHLVNKLGQLRHMTDPSKQMLESLYWEVATYFAHMRSASHCVGQLLPESVFHMLYVFIFCLIELDIH